MSVATRGNRVARMAKLDASAVATLLIEIGRRLVLAGENPYKARAYSRAAQNLLTLTLPLGDVIAAGRLPGQVQNPQGDRVGHPPGRLPRLPGRVVGLVRLRGRERAQPVST